MQQTTNISTPPKISHFAIIGEHTSPQLVDNQVGAFSRGTSNSELMAFWLVRMLATLSRGRRGPMVGRGVSTQISSNESRRLEVSDSDQPRSARITKLLRADGGAYKAT
jgi:hypothetical protein